MTEAPDHDRDRLLDLANVYCDGTATAEEVATLEGLLAVDAVARREFLAFTLVHGQLPYVAEPRQSLSADGSREAAERRWEPGAFGRIAAAIALFTATLGGIGWGVGMMGRGWSDAEGMLATITESRFAVPSDPEASLEVGRRLAAERIAIDAGAVEIRLRNGVTLLLCGPADVELAGEMRAVLRDGSVVVKVPKGMSGFRVETGAAEVLDLGTEFAVRASGGQLTDVQVYEGAVVASQSATASGKAFPHRIEAGVAARFEAGKTGDPEPISYDENRFLRSLRPEAASGEPFASGDRDLEKFGMPVLDSIVVLPMDHPPTIDGALDEWPEGGAFRAFYRNDPAAAEWIEGRMAYDREHLYIAARVGDPHPLRSVVDPELDPDKGWAGGGVQVRVSTDRLAGWPVAGNSYGYYWIRKSPVLPTAAEKAAATNPRLNHLVMWYHEPTRRACLSIAHGMTHEQHAGNPPGYRGAFAPVADGKGYVLEYAIPWSLLGAADDPPQSGDVLAAAWQVHFADESGQIWRRQIIDVRNLAEPYRIGVWQRAATWGKADFR
jgi:ferric-dicitrate binding protein FerR (iron transport regulator)